MKYKSISLSTITIVASLGGFLFGFDMAVVSGVLPFIEKQFSLNAGQQGWFVAAAILGCVIGVALSGELSDRLGRRKPLLIAATFFLLSAVGCAFLPSLFMVIASRILGGIGIGIASNVVPLYISEIAPANIRGRLVTYYQLAITFGVLVAYLSNAALVSYATNATQGTMFKAEIWRAMFGLGAVPAVLFLLGLFIVPESPRWLIQKGRVTEGQDIISRISGQAVADTHIEQTPHHEGSYKELLSPGMRKALLIGILLPLFSQFSGINAIIYYGPQILTSAGIPLSNSLVAQIFFGLANMIFTLIAIWKVDSWGRRPLYLWGTAGAAITLIASGLCFHFGLTSGFLLPVCVLAFLACFAFSIGPLKFVVASEIFPNAIRGRALAISIMTMWIADAIVGQLTPILLKSLGTGGTFWFFAFFCVVAYVVVYKMLPETKGQSLEHIENYWKEKGIDASQLQPDDQHIPIH